jgi:hypothetical protein
VQCDGLPGLAGGRLLEELRQNEKPGYDNHHIVEQWAEDDGIPKNKIQSPENIVPIPKLKHWEINNWFDTPNEGLRDENDIALTPRQFLKGKSWEERYNFGLRVLRDFGVLKP